MRTHSRRSLSRQLLPYLLALFTACSILVFTASAALADTVEIYDDSHVLNISQVRSDASSLSDPIRIYTTRDDANSNSAFDQVTKQKISTTHTLVIAINTLSRHLAIVGGSSAGLSSSQYQDAINAFTSHFSSGGYTGATIAAIDSLKSALKGSGFGSVLLGALCCVGLLLIVGISVFAFVRRRRGGGNVAPVYNAPNQNFGPNYGPGPYPQQPYPQQGGVNPWVAGGLGAAGGGVVGYELGKMEGEREARREMEGQGYYGGGNFGDAGGFGGGASGNFGGGGDNFGGGNSGGDNFGGGNFGGGGDNFGGGGGGDNFGGGGGGDNFGGGNNGGGGNF